jgi:Na+-translocating ferredoxin:NAD+ oxidoreductase RnfG subunit
MAEQESQYRELVRLLLPEELFDYFTVINIKVEDKSVHVYLDEIDNKPVAYVQEKLTSKGFQAEVVIQDFPIRKKAVFLHVRRRKWMVEATGELVSKSWDLTAEGTRYTKSFADFLKGIFGQLPNKQQ